MTDSPLAALPPPTIDARPDPSRRLARGSLYALLSAPVGWALFLFLDHVWPSAGGASWGAIAAGLDRLCLIASLTLAPGALAGLVGVVLGIVGACSPGSEGWRWVGGLAAGANLLAWTWWIPALALLPS